VYGSEVAPVGEKQTKRRHHRIRTTLREKGDGYRSRGLFRTEIRVPELFRSMLLLRALSEVPDLDLTRPHEQRHRSVASALFR
jgi:hypothetical protein